MIKQIDGFQALPWPQLKQKVLELPPIQNDLNIALEQATNITDHNNFIIGHISVIDSLPLPGPNLTHKEKMLRLTMKPYYERLLKYYWIRIKLIEA